ncbi:MAG: flagellar hook-basal body complex protein FliE [Pigmentiphaga sp.]|nr:flagellar hook-basal body complex protein FliE [Pigmentiphaga sp.]
MERITAALGATESTALQRPGMSRAAEMLGNPDGLVANPSKGASDFSNILSDALQSVHQVQQEAKVMQQAYQQGSPDVGLEETMIAMNKASLSFQMLAQARNRVVAAYNEVMNMQV